MKPFQQIPENETPRAPPLHLRSGAWRLALLASVGFHAGLLVWAVLYFSTQSTGARGTQLEGIEIEIISAAALESMMRAPVADSGGGVTAATDAATMPNPMQPDAAPQTTAPQILEKVTVIAAPEADARIAAALPDLEPSPEITPPEVQPPKVQPPTAAPSEAGGATTEANLPSTRQASAAGAAPGDAARYAADVRRVLSRNRPKAGWPAGSVRVAFRVSDTGLVAHAEILIPSRNAQLDQRALAWIGSTRFPTPPVGLTDDERTYALPLTVTGRGS